MKGRTFLILLYPDSTDYVFDNTLIQYINFCIDNDYSYYYIKHNQDEGDKDHIHFLITIPSNKSDRTIKTIAKIGGIEERWVELKNL